MAMDPKFEDLLAVIIDRVRTSDECSFEEKEHEEKIAAAKRAFQPIADCLYRIEADLKHEISPDYVVTEGEWWESKIKDSSDLYGVVYSMGSHEVTFWVSGDYRWVWFAKMDFAISDIGAIDQAIKGWLITQLRDEL